MTFNFNKTFCIAFTLCVVLCGAVVHAKENILSAQDEDFIAMRNAVQDDRALVVNRLALELARYEIPSYVDYYALKVRLSTAPNAQIRDFLKRYDGSAIADRLRNDWLLLLGRTRNFTLFDEQYPLFVLNDDTQVKCYALQSRLEKGHMVAQDARALIVSTKDYGAGCMSLLGALLRTKQYSEDDIWEQVRLVAQSNNAGLAQQVASLIDKQNAKKIAVALKQSSLTVARGPGVDRSSREAYYVALGSLARVDYAKAARALRANSARLSEEERAQAWVMIALWASLDLAPDALELWRNTKGARLSHHQHQWMVRTALRAGDWKQVKEGILAMPMGLRTKPTWVYWLGRALEAEGNVTDAQNLFKSIAEQKNFYGQLSLEALGEKITIPPRAAPVTPEELAAAADNPGFKRSLKMLALNLRFEAGREWNWELRKMNDRQLLAAAQWARQNDAFDRMLSTSDRTKKEMDFEQRYPSPFHDVMRASAQSVGVDVAWAYGLIRQESRFVTAARSGVGASGLMQVMPATAKWVAKKIGWDHFPIHKINEIDTNIALGTQYLKMVSNDFNGTQVLATAAYNAGPGRPRAWRSTLTHPVEGAIFAESIPFDETRGYVKNVLSNATYYAALFDAKPQSLRERLGTIKPK